ncbi:MAG: hypothetical protein FJ304_09460 [Planctomycetes bacterium]|nr:hypothetical protein [Planctomycetota bacterium]
MSDSLFAKFADRASGEAFFLGHLLAAFAARENFDVTALAARLGCTAEVLVQVRTCRAPRTDTAANFRADVTAVARAFGLNAAVLAEMAKSVPGPVPRAPAAPDLEPAPAVLAARDRAEPQ